jgi:LAO/AO transport system kinase
VVEQIVRKVLSGDVRTVARLIRDIDDEVPEARECLKKLYAHTGNAHVVGITGSPGAGKSTLIDQLISHLRSRDKTVGVLAVDPTSPFSGGAVLGDRIRMQRHGLDDGVFIRSLGTRGYFGGITRSTRSAVDVLDAMGKDYILIETVGVGQDEVDVAETAQTTVVVVVPGMGDEVQAIKSGILETADIFVVNKADREGADKTRSDLEQRLDTNPDRYGPGAWRPPVLTTQATRNLGIGDLLDKIGDHAAHLRRSSPSPGLRRRREQVEKELVEMIRLRLWQRLQAQLIVSQPFKEAVAAIANREIDPYTACDRLLASQFGSR